MGVYDYDVETGRTVWSAKLLHILGLPEGQTSGSFDIALEKIHPEDRHVSKVRWNGLFADRVRTSLNTVSFVRMEKHGGFGIAVKSLARSILKQGAAVAVQV